MFLGGCSHQQHYSFGYIVFFVLTYIYDIIFQHIHKCLYMVKKSMWLQIYGYLKFITFVSVGSCRYRFIQIFSAVFDLQQVQQNHSNNQINAEILVFDDNTRARVFIFSKNAVGLQRYGYLNIIYFFSSDSCRYKQILIFSDLFPCCSSRVVPGPYQNRISLFTC